MALFCHLDGHYKCASFDEFADCMLSKELSLLAHHKYYVALTIIQLLYCMAGTGKRDNILCFQDISSKADV